MNNINPKYFLGIAPTTRGVGFAVLEEPEKLTNWGVKSVRGGNKNAKSLKLVKELIAKYQPGALVLEDAEAKGSRRSPRIRKLCKQIIKLAKAHKVGVKLYSRDQLLEALIPDGDQTKHALAQIVAQRFPEDLGSELPPKRKIYETENSRMAVFDATALVSMLVNR